MYMCAGVCVYADAWLHVRKHAVMGSIRVASHRTILNTGWRVCLSVHVVCVMDLCVCVCDVCDVLNMCTMCVV